MILTIEEINDAIKIITQDKDILNIDSIYEKTNDDNLKLIIFFNKILANTKSVIYTKLIFLVNKEKTKLIKNDFIYLYDINCEYKIIKIEDKNDFINKVDNIIKNQEFGDNIKILTEFMNESTFTINEWFRKNNINNINVTNVYYEPKEYKTSCKYLIFPFKMMVNNIDIEIIISKVNLSVFILTIKILNDNINIELNNLSTLIEQISMTLKNYIK